MVLYIVLENTLAKTASGQKIPQGISDLIIDNNWIEWIKTVNPSDIVILSNQTWIYRGVGIRNGERFWSKLKYISEVLREELEKSGKTPRIYGVFSKKNKWIYGLDDNGPSLIEEMWIEHPHLKEQESMFVGDQSDLEYAVKMGITNTLTGI